MKYPTIIQDNFFKEPYHMLDYANSLEYTENDENYPGARTDCLSKINYDLYDSICLKALGLYDKVTGLTEQDVTKGYKIGLYFQKIQPQFGEGWVHIDYPAECTFLVYLNPNAPLDSGTSFYQIKNEYKTKVVDKLTNGLLEKKEAAYKHLDNQGIEESEEARKENNKIYEKTLDIGNVFNRLIMFDADIPHAQNNMNYEHERITLVGFVHSMHLVASPTRRSNHLISI